MSSYRFLATPRWLLLHVLIGSMVVGMIWAAFWQWGRLGERRELNELLDERAAQTALAIEQVLDGRAEATGIDDLEWSPVLVQGDVGAFVAGGNQQRGAVLDLRAIVLDDDSVVLVVRGRQPEGFDDGAIAGDQVTVEGALRRRPGTGPLSIDLDRLEDLARSNDSIGGGVIRPGYVQMLASAPPPEPDLELIALPERNEGNHLSYTGQWIIFASLCALGYGLMIRRTGRERGREAAIVKARDHDF